MFENVTPKERKLLMLMGVNTIISMVITSIVIFICCLLLFSSFTNIYIALFTSICIALMTNIPEIHTYLKAKNG